MRALALPKLRFNLVKFGQSVLLFVYAAYSIHHFYIEALAKTEFGDLFLILEKTKAFVLNGQTWDEFGAMTPFLTLILIPFTYLSPNQAATVLQGLDFLCIVGIFWFFRLTVLPQARLSWLLIVSLLGLQFHPIAYAIRAAKIEPIELLLLFMGLSCFKERRDFIAGGLLASAALLKMIPGIALIYFLYKREWRVLYGALFFSFVITALTLTLFGIDYHWYYATSVAQGYIPWIFNQSMEAAIQRWWAPLPPTEYYPNPQMGRAFYFTLSTLKLVVLGALLYLSRNKLRDRTDNRFYWEVAVWFLAVPFLVRFFRFYYGIFFLPFLFEAARDWAEKSEFINKKTLVLFLVGYLFIGLGPLSLALSKLGSFYPDYSNYHLFVYLSFPFYGFLIFLGLGMWRLYQSQVSLVNTRV